MVMNINNNIFQRYSLPVFLLFWLMPLWANPFDVSNRQDNNVLLTQLIEVKHRQATEIFKLLREQQVVSTLKHTLVVDEGLNALMVRGTKQQIKALQEMVHLLDQKLSQVEILAHVVVVSESAANDFGSHLGFQYHDGLIYLSGNTSKGKMANTGAGLEWRLAALEKKGLCEVISSPRILTTNLHQAVIESGEEIPFHTSLTRDGVTEHGVQFKKAVLSLQVKPFVTPKQQIKLHLNVHQDSRGEATQTGVAIDTQTIQTEVTLDNMETVALGGVWRSTESTLHEGIPVLGHIPYIGYLFSSAKKVVSKQKLWIFVTPKIVNID